MPRRGLTRLVGEAINDDDWFEEFSAQYTSKLAEWYQRTCREVSGWDFSVALGEALEDIPGFFYSDYERWMRAYEKWRRRLEREKQVLREKRLKEEEYYY